MSYRIKLTITISLLIALSFGIGGTTMIATSFSTSLKKETQATLDAFETVQNTLYLVNSLADQADYKSLATVLGQMAERGLASWQSLTLASSREIIYQDGNFQMLDYEIQDPGANQCSYLRVSDGAGYGIIIRSHLLAGEEQLTLTTRFDLSQVYEMRRVQQRQYSVIYLAVVCFGVFASSVLAYTLTRPLRRLTTTVRRISGGDLSRRSKLDSNDEFGQLSRDFDAMADKLQENISRLETDMQRQESFMGAFAHELKTPMTSIIGFADLLRQGNLDENTRMMAADYIYSEGHRLERLSFKLLDLLLLKKDEVVFKGIWLQNYVTEIQQALSPGLKNKGIQLVCRAEQKRVAFEPDLVKSLVYNLIDNASKAMEGDGIIALQARAIPGGCQFVIADNGRGMEEKELTKITEAFYRVDKARSRSQGGAGLGLALCRQIVELHNGSIHFASTPGKGTKVTVIIYGKVGAANAE